MPTPNIGLKIPTRFDVYFIIESINPEKLSPKYKQGIPDPDPMSTDPSPLVANSRPYCPENKYRCEVERGLTK